MQPTSTELIEILKSKTTIDETTGCWLHNGSFNNSGYSHVTYQYRTVSVHRLSAHIYHGMLLDEPTNVNHKAKCPNKNCWNPNHIYVGTQQENYQDSIKAGHNHNKSKTHCIHGHEFTKENTAIYGSRRKCKACYRKRNWERHFGYTRDYENK